MEVLSIIVYCLKEDLLDFRIFMISPIHPDNPLILIILIQTTSARQPFLVTHGRVCPTCYKDDILVQDSHWPGAVKPKRLILIWAAGDK